MHKRLLLFRVLDTLVHASRAMQVIRINRMVQTILYSGGGGIRDVAFDLPGEGSAGGGITIARGLPEGGGGIGVEMLFPLSAGGGGIEAEVFFPLAAGGGGMGSENFPPPLKGGGAIGGDATAPTLKGGGGAFTSLREDGAIGGGGSDPKSRDLAGASGTTGGGVRTVRKLPRRGFAALTGKEGDESLFIPQVIWTGDWPIK